MGDLGCLHSGLAWIGMMPEIWHQASKMLVCMIADVAPLLDWYYNVTNDMAH